VLGTFLGAELGLQATINFEGKTRFGLFDRSAWHSKSVVMDACRSGYGESGMADKACSEDREEHERLVRSSALRGRADNV
jgi:hypothetical protein